MFNDQRNSNGSRDTLENGIKQLTSFLRVPRLPGKARLNRIEVPSGSQQAATASGSPASRRAGPSGPAGETPAPTLEPELHSEEAAGASASASAAHASGAGSGIGGVSRSAGSGSSGHGAGSGVGGGDAAAHGSNSSQQAEQQLSDLRLHGSGEPSSSSADATGAAADDSTGGHNGASGAAAAASSGGVGAGAGDRPSAPAVPAPAAGPSTSSSAGTSEGVSQSRASSAIRVRKFHKLLLEQVVDLDALRELSWSGIPGELRPLCWRLLLGYLPPNKSRQAQVLLRKRREYADMVPELYDIANSERSEDEIGALRQVSVDVPRTAPSVPFFHEPVIQKGLERMLYIWGIRHPASGYVQGMNDLVTPFLAVFLSECLPGPMGGWTAGELTEAVMLDVEADCYWCLCKLLEGIQDHYTYAQPGIQRTVFRLKELVRKQHEPLVAHMEREGVDFLQFAFRWVNCLLIREVPFDAALRLWDTYLAEGTKFADFLVYVCAAFLARWERSLVSMEFQELMLYLQKLPTQDWGDSEMESVLSAAYVLRNVWQHAQSHLQA